MKKGFTLIELLAVIVILALIALISVPIIIGLIDDARKEAFENTAYGIAKSGEIYFSKNLMSGTLEEVTFTYTDGVESSSVVGKTLDYNGSKPESGTVVITDEGKTKIIIYNGTYCAIKGFDDSEVILSDIPKEECVFADISGASIPELTIGMIPVKWDGTNWVKADVNNVVGSNEWYDYDAKEWANAVTVTSTNRTNLLSASAGTVIPISDINTMWVWIPRYKYAIPTGTGARSINIVFESKATSKSTGNAIDTNYKTHPAFTFDTTEVSGMWIGKFETTGTIGAPTILPNTTSLRNQTAKALYDASRAMQNNTTYGTSMDTNIHMVKDSEWGAVAYLSNSQYGKNSEIFINPSSSYITGRGGNTVSQANTTDASGGASTNLFSYDGKECSTKTGYVCTGTLQSVYGMSSSTTGNIYGVYDMSGGAWEYVMSMYRPTDTTSVTDSSDFGAATTTGTLPEIKYWDRYTTTSAATACSGGICYGNALSETSNWYSDSLSFVSIVVPWMRRGGAHSSATGSGIFGYSNGTGASGSDRTLRLVQLKP